MLPWLPAGATQRPSRREIRPRPRRAVKPVLCLKKEPPH